MKSAWQADEGTAVQLEQLEIKMGPERAAAPVESHRLRVVGLTCLVILLGVFGNLSLAWGMTHTHLTMGLHPLAYVQVLASPFVTMGVVLLIFWLLTRMALMSRSDLSFVLPATAVGYVLNAVLAVWLLKEVVSPFRWFGTLLIFAGAALVGSDPKGLNTSSADESSRHSS